MQVVLQQVQRMTVASWKCTAAEMKLYERDNHDDRGGRELPGIGIFLLRACITLIMSAKNAIFERSSEGSVGAMRAKGTRTHERGIGHG